MLVAKITGQKAEELKGTEFQPDQYYNPIQMGDGSWIVSLVEAQYLNVGNFEVVEYIPLSDTGEG